MDRFAPALRRVADELDLPFGARAAILLEMAADLESAYEHHRALGCDDGEAARRAEEAVLGSSEVIRRLSQLHRDSWLGWAEAIGERLGRGIDLALLLVAVVPILVVAGVTAARVLVSSGSLFAGLLIGIGLVIAGLVAVEIWRLLHDRPGAALTLLLLLSGVAPVLGLLAFSLRLYTLSMELAGPGSAVDWQTTAAARLAQDGAVLLVGLLLGIAGGIAWFLLVNREVRATARQIDALLTGDASVLRAPRAPRAVALVKRKRA